MNISVVTHGYPTKKTASAVFVANLADEMANQGHSVTVIAPQSLTNIIGRDGALSPTKFVHKTDEGKEVIVLRPYTLSFSKGFAGKLLNGPLRRLAIKRAIKQAPEPDVYYSHFWGTAHGLYEVIKNSGKPLFVASGESEVTFRDQNDGFAEFVRGVICVSTKNKDESIFWGLTTADKCVILPNAINESEFYHMDKKSCREELGIPQDAFVVGQVGTICNRKGQGRVSDAIKKLDDKGIYSFFLGRCQDNIPDCPNIIKLGFTDHKNVAKYLNAADVYVFPSLAEGCSNSIVEAMACGLPIISSDLPFNYDILDDTNSIMLDPSSVDSIAEAIAKVKADSEYRASMSKASLHKAADLRLKVRASKIITFIKERI